MAVSFIVEETGVPRENHRSAASHWQTLSHNVVSSTTRLKYKKNSLALLVYRLPFYRQPRLLTKFSSVPISPIKNTLLYCQTQLPPSATGFQTQKS